ncbi:response regulator [candidate division WOR-3 bacterium]|nr:response regulator [candidate division WOR-3 bacterium]
MKKVLLVDDDEDFIETVKFYLIHSGYLVSVAKNGEEAFDKLKIGKPDIILLDVMMPGIEGTEVCKKLKADSDLSSIPIMMVTAKGQREDIENAIKAGANGYIPKPFSLPRLVERIEELISRT